MLELFTLFHYAPRSKFFAQNVSLQLICYRRKWKVLSFYLPYFCCGFACDGFVNFLWPAYSLSLFHSTAIYVCWWWYALCSFCIPLPLCFVASRFGQIVNKLCCSNMLCSCQKISILQMLSLGKLFLISNLNYSYVFKTFSQLVFKGTFPHNIVKNCKKIIGNYLFLLGCNLYI